MDSQSQLAEYKLQLQQVEAALTTDPNNEDLKKLQHDLTEVINLTEDLILSQLQDEAGSADTADPSSTATAAAHASHWRVGDKCMALFTEDEQYYEATIDEVQENGMCTITFDEYGNTEVTQVILLQPCGESLKRKGDEEGGPEAKSFMSKRDQINAQKEYKRKKNLKKQQRMKALDEEREGEKNKWLSFNAKTFGKTSKGRVKKSIFATPDASTGRVGVGTCGVGGQKMTTFTHAQKWKKN